MRLPTEAPLARRWDAGASTRISKACRAEANRAKAGLGEAWPQALSFHWLRGLPSTPAPSTQGPKHLIEMRLPSPCR